MTTKTPIKPIGDVNGKCEECGKEWKTQNRVERFCSMACRFAARSKA